MHVSESVPPTTDKQSNLPGISPMMWSKLWLNLLPWSIFILALGGKILTAFTDAKDQNSLTSFKADVYILRPSATDVASSWS